MPGDSILPIEGMLEALRRLEGYAEVGAREGYPTEGALMDAILRRVDLLSTHAHAVSEDFVAGNTDLPWRRLRALRDVIRAYGGGDPELAWAFVRNHVPGLRRGVEELLEAAREAEDEGETRGERPTGPGRRVPVGPARTPAGHGTFLVHRKQMAVVAMDPAAPLPGWWVGVSDTAGGEAPLTALIRTPSEWTAYLPEERLPADVSAERGFRVLELQGPLPFDAVGVLSRITASLARAGVPLMALSTFGTDLILVRGDRLEAARDALRGAGYQVRDAAE